MTTSEPLGYYLQWECPNCDETNYAGLNVSFLTNPANGHPAIPYDDAAQQAWTTCTDCGTTSYTGDLELMTDV